MTKPERIFIVDDNEIDCLIIETLIRQQLPEVVISRFKNGNTPLAALQTEAGQAALPDLIFLDLAMPGSDGWDFLDGIELIPLVTRPVIYILSSSIHYNDVERAKQYPSVEEMLAKPFTTHQLLKILQKHFNTHI